MPEGSQAETPPFLAYLLSKKNLPFSHSVEKKKKEKTLKDNNIHNYNNYLEG